MSRNHYAGRRGPPWSKLKSRIEALFAPGLRLAIHSNVYTKEAGQHRFEEPRHWFLLDGVVIWDFPGPAMRPEGFRQWKPITYFDDAYSVHRPDVPGQVQGLTYRRYSPPRSSVIALLLRDYLDRPVASLMESFPEDGWELTDVLRAADRRLGKSCLTTWGSHLDPDHPAKPVLQARFTRAPCQK